MNLIFIDGLLILPGIGTLASISKNEQEPKRFGIRLPSRVKVESTIQVVGFIGEAVPKRFTWNVNDSIKTKEENRTIRLTNDGFHMETFYPLW